MSMDMTPLVRLNVVVSMGMRVECKAFLALNGIQSKTCLKTGIHLQHVGVSQVVLDPLTLAKHTTCSPLSHSKDPMYEDTL